MRPSIKEKETGPSATNTYYIKGKVHFCLWPKQIGTIMKFILAIIVSFHFKAQYFRASLMMKQYEKDRKTID